MTSKVNVSEPERWVSAAGGSALFIYGLRRRGLMGFALAGVGAALFSRAASGYCPVRASLEGGALSSLSASPERFLSIHKAVTIDEDPQKAFEYWRNLANLPKFMDHLESVTVHDDKHSHWIAKGPLGKTIEWDTEIVRETKGRLIEWRSVSGGDLESSGSVRFSKRQNGRGTKVHYAFRYEPPANGLGLIVAKLFSANPEKQVHEELQKFKQVIEAV